jgi:hypothetical protein
MDWYFVVSCMDSLIPYVPFRRLILCSNLHGFIDSLCSLSWIGTLQLSSFYWLFFIFTDMDSLFPYFRIVVSNTYCVCLSSSCAPYVASFSGLSIFDGPIRYSLFHFVSWIGTLQISFYFIDLYFIHMPFMIWLFRIKA